MKDAESRARAAELIDAAEAARRLRAGAMRCMAAERRLLTQLAELIRLGEFDGCPVAVIELVCQEVHCFTCAAGQLLVDAGDIMTTRRRKGEPQ